MCGAYPHREGQRYAKYMPDEALIKEIVETAKRMIKEARIDGDDVAQELGRDPYDDELSDAFHAIEERGLLKVDSWGGETKLPHAIQLP